MSLYSSSHSVISCCSSLGLFDILELTYAGCPGILAIQESVVHPHCHTQQYVTNFTFLRILQKKAENNTEFTDFMHLVYIYLFANAFVVTSSSHLTALSSAS